VTMVGLDVTMKTIMSEAYLASLKASRTGKFIYDISRFYQAFHEQYGLEGIHTHDPSALAYLIDPTLFKTEAGAVRVITEGIALGQTLMDRRQRWQGSHGWTDIPKTDVCLEVDSERLLALYKERITTAP
jgi:purine nucleosidase